MSLIAVLLFTVVLFIGYNVIKSSRAPFEITGSLDFGCFNEMNVPYEHYIFPNA